MSDVLTDEVIEAPKGFVTFERSIQVRDYEPAKASLMLQIPSRPGDTVDDLIAASRSAFFAAKAVVFEQLGITFDATEDGRAMEVLEQKLSAVEVTPQQEAVAMAAASTVRTETKAAAPSTKDGLWTELCSNPKAWFDNRETKRSEKAADFKRKNTGEGLWVSYNGKPNTLPVGCVLPDPSAF